MRHTKLASLGGALGVLADAGIGLLGVVPASGHTDAPTPSQQSLRSLAARNNLYVGTAVNVSALDDTTDPQYRSLVASQFSTVTPENVMKWDILEPTQGTYNWGPPTNSSPSPRPTTSCYADIRWSGSTSCCPAHHWVNNGTISDAQPRDLLKKQITDVVTHFKGKIWQWDVADEAASDPWDSPPAIHLKGFWAQHLGPN